MVLYGVAVRNASIDSELQRVSGRNSEMEEEIAQLQRKLDTMTITEEQLQLQVQTLLADTVRIAYIPSTLPPAAPPAQLQPWPTLTLALFCPNPDPALPLSDHPWHTSDSRCWENDTSYPPFYAPVTEDGVEPFAEDGVKSFADAALVM